MGIRAVQLRRHFDFYYTDAISRLWGRLFSCVWDGVIMLDPDEVESGAFMSLQVTASFHLGVVESPDLERLRRDRERPTRGACDM